MERSILKIVFSYSNLEVRKEVKILGFTKVDQELVEI